MRYITIAFLFWSLMACEPDFPNGEITCDPRATNQCPKGFICMENPSTPGDYRCYNSYTTYGYCGDGTVQEKFEDCDPEYVAETTCSDLTYNDPDGVGATAVVCQENCRWDMSGCEGMTRCGDGKVQTEFGEMCDGETMEMGCMDVNSLYTMGFPICTGDCQIDEGYCYEELQNQVDFLFVVDDRMDGSMENFRTRLVSSMRAFYNSLNMQTMGWPFSYHFGVVSSSLAMEQYGCGDTATDGLFTGDTRCGLINGGFLRDLTPAKCSFEGNYGGVCTNVSCEADSCDLLGEGLKLVYDDGGCPRCVNTAEALGTVQDKLECLLSPPDMVDIPCDISQPLKAMELAVNDTINPGFVRPDALLMVVFVTNGDDCSIEAGDRFGQVLDQYPYSPQFACLKGGTVCNEGWSDLTAGTTKTFSGCIPRTDENRTLFDLDHFIEAMKERKGGKNIIALSLTGDDTGEIVVQASEGLGYYEPEINNGTIEDPIEEVQYDILDTCFGAKPSLRIRQFVKRFAAQDQMNGGYSICNAHYPNALGSLSNTIISIFMSGMVIMDF